MKRITSLAIYGIFYMIISSGCGSKTNQVEADAPQGPIKVEIKEENGKYALFRDGQSYSFNGAGFEFGDIESFVAHGGTSFRTWRTDNARETGQQVLDKALKYGLSVTMCLEITRERHGFDYDDQEVVFTSQWPVAPHSVTI